MGWYQVQKLAPAVHLIGEAGQVNAYLVEGAQHAALIDTGTGIADIRSQVLSLTSKPVIVLNTHSHWDHIGGNHQFDQIGIHSAEAEHLAVPWVPDTAINHLRRLESQGLTLPKSVDLERFSVTPSQATFHLEHGMELDLGGRRLQVWHTPGHSPGSICFLDEEARLLFSGDTVFQGVMSLNHVGSHIDDLLQSTTMLAEMAWEINLLLPGHGMTPLDGRMLLEVSEALRQTVAGTIPLKKGFSATGAVRVAAFERFMFFLPPDWKPPTLGERTPQTKGD